MPSEGAAIYTDTDKDGNVIKKYVKDFESLVYFPINIGCTGQAIYSKKVVYFNKEKREYSFSTEIDNQIGVPYVDSLMIGPLYDTEGNLRGVIQLVNKLENQRITEKDEIEFRSMLPSIAESIRTADDVRKLYNIATSMAEQLYYSDNAIK